MTCSYCGAWQPHDASAGQYCIACGHPLSGPHVGATTSFAAPALPQPGAPANPSLLRHPATWGVVAAVIVTVGAVLTALIVTSGQTPHDSRSVVAAPSAPYASTAVAAVSSTASSAVTPAPATSTIVVPPPVTKTVTAPAPSTQPDYSGSGVYVPGTYYDRFASSNEVDASAYSTGSDSVRFDAPSGNISCLIAGGSRPNVGCTIGNYNFSEPGHDCSVGAGTLMYADSYAVIDCVSFLYGGEPTLAYGDSIVLGTLTCVSETSGVSCANTDDGSGFFLSRDEYQAVRS